MTARSSTAHTERPEAVIRPGIYRGVVGAYVMPSIQGRRAQTVRIVRHAAANVSASLRQARCIARDT